MMSRFVLGAPVQSTAEDLLDTAKDQVSSTLQAGQGVAEDLVETGQLDQGVDDDAPGIQGVSRPGKQRSRHRGHERDLDRP